MLNTKKKRMSTELLKHEIEMQKRIIDWQHGEILRLQNKVEELDPSSYSSYFSQLNGIPGCSCD